MFNPYYDSVVSVITVVLHGDGTRDYLVVGEEVQVVTVTSPMSRGDRILGLVGEPTCHH